MLIHYTICYQIYTTASVEAGEAGETGVEVEDSGNLAEVLRSVVRLYGIVAHGDHDVGTWWGTNEPVKGHRYYTLGEEKYFTFHINTPAISPRNRDRINRMLRALW